MPLDITKPAVIIFLKERYDKESRLRAQWIFKHRDKLELAATLHREPTDYFETDVIKANITGGMAAITRDHVVAGYNRRKIPLRDAATIPGIENLQHGHSIVNVGLGNPKEDPRLVRPDTDLSPDPIMRPVEPKLKKILYKPKPTFGREQYLRRRADKQPERKYYFSECSNWDYGWRTNYSRKQSMPHYGRCFLLKKTMHSRVGPQPDPEHYRSADVPEGPEKCTAI